MLKKYAFIACFLLAFSAASQLSAGTISKVEYSGLKRTKTALMDRFTAQYLNTDSENVNLEELKNNIKLCGLFSECEPTFVDNGDGSVTLKLALKEKWTIIPVPIFSFSNSGFIGGAYLADTNTFGMGNFLMGGGVFGKDVISVSAMYSGFGFTTNAFYEKTNTEIHSLEEKKISEYDIQRLGGSLGFGMPVLKNVSANAKVNLQQLFSDSSNYDSAFQVSFEPSITYKINDFTDWFISTSYVSVSGEFGYNTTNDFISGMKIKAVLQKPIIDRLRASIGICYSAEADKGLLFTQNRNSVASHILPEKFRSKKMANADVGLEVGVARGRAIMLSLFGNFQETIVEDYDGQLKFMYGPMAGTIIYLRQINIPAFSFGLAYNIPQEQIQIVASMGMSF